MATCESIEYIVLADNTSDLETALKDNLRPIVEQLRKEGLLKDAVYERVKDTQVNLTSLERAGMIVTSVKEYVQIEPSNYYKFISILKREERHYRDVIKILEKSYREHQRGKEKDEPDLPTSIPVSGNENFPLLRAGDFTEELMARLEVESVNMSQKFTVLVTCTKDSLRDQNIEVEDLIVIIKNMHFLNGDKNKLIKKLSKIKGGGKSIAKAFKIMSDFWSFFDYDLLSGIILNYQKKDSDLQEEFSRYTSSFKEYCQRRLCEVPVEALAVQGDYLWVKLDKAFDVKLEEFKTMNAKLSSILGTNIRLVKFKGGCIELAYITMHELDAIFPLSAAQEKELIEMDVRKIYNDREVFFDAPTKEEIRDTSSREVTARVANKLHFSADSVTGSEHPPISLPGVDTATLKPTGDTATLRLVQVSTGKSRTAMLYGVKAEEFNQEDADIFFHFVTDTARADPSLPDEDCNNLCFLPESESSQAPSSAIASRLQAIADIVEKDTRLKELDERVFSGSEIPHSQEGFFTMTTTHMLDVLKHLFSDEVVANSTPHKLLIYLALVFKYCYNFCKRAIQYARRTLRVLSYTVFNVLCHIGAALTRHLINIQWKAILERVGGWVSLLGSYPLYEAENVTSPSLAALVAGGILAGGVGLVLYLGRSLIPKLRIYS